MFPTEDSPLDLNYDRVSIFLGFIPAPVYASCEEIEYENAAASFLVCSVILVLGRDQRARRHRWSDVGKGCRQDQSGIIGRRLSGWQMGRVYLNVPARFDD